MPRIATRHAHKLAYRRRLSLGLRMLGCLVTLAGAIVLAAALAELAKGALLRQAWLMIVSGAALFLSGAALFCGERGLLIDRETRTVKRWWGVVLPLRSTCDDISHYHAVGFFPSADTALPRWRVCLCNAQGEQIELFELTAEDVAEFAARQVAGFLSLSVVRPSFDGGGGAQATPVKAGVAPEAASPSDRRWTYRGHFGFVTQGMGVVCLVLGVVLTLGLLRAANLGQSRWLTLIATVAPFCLAGLWFFTGGRKAVIDADAQTIRLWRAWPLPPAVYELSAFYAVIVAPESMAAADEVSPPHLIGLIGAEQLRLEVVRGLSPVEALPAAKELATITRLPLVEEPPLVPADSAHIT